MKLLNGLALTFLLAFSQVVFAKDCHDAVFDNITFTRQAQLDNYMKLNYPNYDESQCGLISVSSTIEVSGADITDLSALGHFTDEQLVIENNPKLTSLSGLKGVTNFQSLLIRSNPNLTNLNGLEDLVAITGMEQLPGYPKIESNLDITANSNLTDIGSLQQLRSVSGTVVIQNNRKLSSLNGLNALVNIGGMLVIRDEPLLTNLQGLGSGDQGALIINGGIAIMDNSKLMSIAALQDYAVNVATLNISGNTVLTTLKGIEQLKPLDGNKTHFYFAAQPNLVMCRPVCNIWKSSTKKILESSVNPLCLSLLSSCP